MRFQLLGPVCGWIGERPVNLGVRKQRFVLAVLALEANTLVPTSRLVDLVWPDDPPASARGMIHTYVSGLRAVFSHTGSAGVSLLGHPAGYELRCDPARVDVHLFLSLAARARAANDDERLVALLDEALGLWQGPALAGVANEDVRTRMCHHLDAARLTAVEDRAEALLRLGRHEGLVDQLTVLSAEHPTRQRLTGQLMLALHRAGRSADALHAYERARRRLADELGIDPDTNLRELHQSLLRGGLDRPAPPTRPVRPATLPAQLPADVSAFTGRGAELAQLDTLLGGSRPGNEPTAIVISAVSGTAGVGKPNIEI